MNRRIILAHRCCPILVICHAVTLIRLAVLAMIVKSGRHHVSPDHSPATKLSSPQHFIPLVLIHPQSAKGLLSLKPSNIPTLLVLVPSLLALQLELKVIFPLLVRFPFSLTIVHLCTLLRSRRPRGNANFPFIHLIRISEFVSVFGCPPVLHRHLIFHCHLVFRHHIFDDPDFRLVASATPSLLIHSFNEDVRITSVVNASSIAAWHQPVRLPSWNAVGPSVKIDTLLLQANKNLNRKRNDVVVQEGKALG